MNDSILYKKSLKHATMDDELAHLSLQIAVGVALRANPVILQYLTMLSEDKLQSLMDVSSVTALSPDLLKNVVLTAATEAGIAQHMHDLLTNVEDRTQAYNRIHAQNNQSPE